MKTPKEKFTRSIGGGADKAMNAAIMIGIIKKPKPSDGDGDEMPMPKMPPMPKASSKGEKAKAPKGPKMPKPKMM